MKRALVVCTMQVIAIVGSGCDCPSNTSVMLPGGTLIGSALNGKMIFMSNGCTSCHCSDAGGGCGVANAPNLTCVTYQEIDERLRGGPGHPGGQFDFSDQEIADLQAYFVNPTAFNQLFP